MRIVFTFLLLILLTTTLLSQIPNFSFENWGPNPEDSSAQCPVDWICNNGGDYPNFVRISNSATDGTKSTKLAVVPLAPGSNYGGQILQAFPYSSLPTKITFKYQMNLGSGTPASVTANIISYNGAAGQQPAGSYSGAALSTQTNGWTYRELPITPAMAIIPDSALISFLLNAETDTTAFFMIDDIHLSNQPVGIANYTENEFLITLFENENNIQVTFLNGSAETPVFSISDLIGRPYPVTHNRINSTHWNLDTSTLAQGVYLVQARSSRGSFAQKVLISK
jgi:hypothetical protein